MGNIEETWEKTKNYLKEELPRVSYETWICPLNILRFDKEKNLLFLSSPAGLEFGVVQDRYLSIIESAATRAFGASLSVMLRKEQEKEKTSEDALSINYNEETFLNPKYVFDTFVVGKNNLFAHAASLAVAENPSVSYNPLFLYGGAGLGKTHLMHAIGQSITEKFPSLAVLYVSSEMFTNELIRSIRENKTASFREKYRNIDVLMIDDIQFIENKDSVQEEIFHTFNALYDSHKQIILTSDRPPKDIATIEERLRSRFEWGLTADIQPPDFETRVAILSKKATIEKISVNEDFLDVIKLIAERIQYNIRELEGAFIRVVAYATFTGNEITCDLAKEALKDVFSPVAVVITAEKIKKIVCTNLDVKENDMISSKRSRNIAYPRQIAMYLCRELTSLSLPKIGEAFGNRDHTTVLHAVDKITADRKKDPELEELITNLIHKIKEE